MTAKEYLNKIATYRRALDDLAWKIEALYQEAGGLKAIVYDKDRVQVSPENKFEQMMMKVEAEAQKWARMKVRYEKEVRKRIDQIDRLSNPDHAEILRLRYVDLKQDGRQRTLEEISVKIGLSFYRTAHLHGEALAEFSRRCKLSKH